MPESLTAINAPGVKFPVFLNPGKVNLLLITDAPGVNILHSLIRQSPDLTISIILTGTMVADLPAELPESAVLVSEKYNKMYIDGHSFVILNIHDQPLVEEINRDVRQKGKLLQVVGQPALSDFSFISEELPTPHNKRIHDDHGNAQANHWRKIATWCLFGLACMLIGHAIFTYFPLSSVWEEAKLLAGKTDSSFYWMLAAGFFAQLVDGALGMGYGVISTSILLSTGLNPAAISGSIHTAEMFSSGASGFSHYRFGNVNKKLFRTLLIPGVLGAIVGAALLFYLGEKNGAWVRPVLSVYTLLLGLRILTNAFKKKSAPKKVKHAGWLAGAGGFLDSFGGGGWGPLVTSTLISKGRTPRFVIGTVSLTEFFVTLGSALTFFLLLGVSHIQTIAGLIIGGLLAAPIAARLVGKLKLKSMLIGVGVLVILSSLRTLWKAIAPFL